jgi:hypothetical protein
VDLKSGPKENFLLNFLSSSKVFRVLLASLYSTLVGCSMKRTLLETTDPFMKLEHNIPICLKWTIKSARPLNGWNSKLSNHFSCGCLTENNWSQNFKTMIAGILPPGFVGAHSAPWCWPGMHWIAHMSSGSCAHIIQNNQFSPQRSMAHLESASLTHVSKHNYEPRFWPSK